MRKIQLQVLRRTSCRKAFQFLPGKNHPKHMRSKAVDPDNFGQARLRANTTDLLGLRWIHVNSFRLRS
jgi:hypothetical protein